MWTFPKRIPRTNQVLDAKDFTQGYMPFVRGLGRLDAHNFSNALSTELVSNLATDVHRRCAYVSIERDDDDRNTTPVPQRFTLQQVGVWQAVDDLSLSFASRGGTLQVFTSLQMMRPKDNDAASMNLSNLYLQVGIAIDGTLIPESVVGDLDNLQAGPGMETGIVASAFGACTHINLPVATGYHTVQTYVRALQGPYRYPIGSYPINLNLPEGDPSNAHPYGTFYAGSRSLLVIEDH